MQLLQIDAAQLTDLEQQDLAAHEAVIERGLKTFVDVGQALLSIRDGRLYRAQFGTFEDYCQERWQITPQHGHRLMAAAATWKQLEPIGSILPATESQARPLTQLPPDVQPIIWQRAVETAPNGKITAAHVQSVVDDYRNPPTDNEDDEELPIPTMHYELYDEFGGQDHIVVQPDEELVVVKKGKPESLHVSDDSYEWFTPAEYIEAARRVMGSIDTDPASCAEANTVVQAGTYYTVDDDGLLYEWPGNVWLNPPYNMPWIEKFALRAVEEYLDDPQRSIIVLTNNSSDTAWFHALLDTAMLCLTRGRIRFWSTGGEVLATRQGQAIFYMGPHRARFATEFARFGAIVETV